MPARRASAGEVSSENSGVLPQRQTSGGDLTCRGEGNSGRRWGPRESQERDSWGKAFRGRPDLLGGVKGQLGSPLGFA